MRVKAAMIVNDALTLPGVQVVGQTRAAFLAALNLYRMRQDKSYSLTDCISMNTMRELRITDVLTHDHHFAQEGFNVML